MENVFGTVRQKFCELLLKSELTVTFLPDVIVCCAILHNLLLAQSRKAMEQLLNQLRQEGLHGKVVDDDNLPHEVPDFEGEGLPALHGQNERAALGVYLMTTRHV